MDASGNEAPHASNLIAQENVKNNFPKKRAKARKTDTNLLETSVNSFIPKDPIDDAKEDSKDDSNKNCSPEGIFNFCF